jgi:Domain of unknown function (DUF1899)
MAGRFVRASKYRMRQPRTLAFRHLTAGRSCLRTIFEEGTILRQYTHIKECLGYKFGQGTWNLLPGLSAHATPHQANPEYLSVNWESSGGGAFAVIPLNERGKLPERIPLFRGHTAAVLDTDWYVEHLLLHI